MIWLIIVAIVWYVFTEGSTEAKGWMVLFLLLIALFACRRIKANADGLKVIQDYDRRLKKILGPILGEQMWSFCENLGKDDKLEKLNAMKRKLKLLKREVQVSSKEIKGEFTRRGSQAPGSSLGEGMQAGLFGWKIDHRVRARERQRERSRKFNALEPFEGIIAKIDSVLLQLDTAILEVEEET